MISGLFSVKAKFRQNHRRIQSSFNIRRLQYSHSEEIASRNKRKREENVMR